MDVFKKSKWIWARCPKMEDQYTEYVEILGDVDENACLNISTDTDYTVFINDAFVASNQYGDYEHYKIYDAIDITSFLTKKENKLKIIAYHCGVNTQRYRKAEAGLIFEVVSGEKIIAYSSESTLSRMSPTYVSGNKRFVSTQLGFTFGYDATKEQENNYFPSIRVDKTVKFYKRPIEKIPGGLYFVNDHYKGDFLEVDVESLIKFKDIDEESIYVFDGNTKKFYKEENID
jgi:hypothetical protein